MSQQGAENVLNDDRDVTEDSLHVHLSAGQQQQPAGKHGLTGSV